MSDDPDRSAGFHPAERSAGVSPAGARASRPRWGEIHVKSRGRLPHWEVEAGTYFVTFRLHDSIPDGVVQQMKVRLTQMGIRDDRDLSRRLQYSIDKYIARGTGACYLREPKVGSLVNDAIQQLDGKEYRLLAWAVMPNHVHLVFKLLPGRTLAQVMHSLKSFTAKQANAVLRRTGTFWQREYYDRTPRNEQELVRALEYTLNNPLEAGLINWPWVGWRP